MLPFTMEELQQEVDAGYVRVQSHPILPYKIYNYSEKTQFDKRWNNVTLNCRGLILDDEEIVARPWKKFFNLGEGYAEFDWDSPVEVTDKIDGSLGILYSEGYSGYAIATRGSFNSDQALHATRIWKEKYQGWVDPNDETWTILFEIVYPSNRIVLNYGDMDDLVLLGAVDKDYGYYLGPNEVAATINWPGPVTEVFAYRTLQEAFSADPRENAEGYVVRSGNKMVKIKQDDYIELHRLVTNLTPKSIWEQLAAGKSVEEICSIYPDEWMQHAQNIANDLIQKHNDLYNVIVTQYLALTTWLPAGFSRKQFAEKAKQTDYAKYLFAMLDDREVSDMIWQSIKPKGELNE